MLPRNGSCVHAVRGLLDKAACRYKELDGVSFLSLAKQRWVARICSDKFSAKQQAVCRILMASPQPAQVRAAAHPEVIAGIPQACSGLQKPTARNGKESVPSPPLCELDSNSLTCNAAGT